MPTNTLKNPGPSGIISVKADVKGAVPCIERLTEAMTVASPEDG